jgi:hypothetical protein
MACSTCASHTDLIDLRRAEGSSFISEALTLHLLELKHPENSITSMLKCGMPYMDVLGSCTNSECSLHGDHLVSVKHKCNLRTCPECSKRRKGRLAQKYVPFFNQLKSDRLFSRYFLTISPENYDSLEEGLNHIQKSLSKFLRRDYIKQRIKAGIYVIECKEHWAGKKQFDKNGNYLYTHNKHGWNIHLHMIIYSRRLNNRVYGTCEACNQHLLKWDSYKRRFYCANKKCNSINVHSAKDSHLQREWEDCSKRSAHIHITKQWTSLGSVNYMTKYIGANKDDFQNVKSMAKYINVTYRRRLISAFGGFYSKKKRLEVFGFDFSEIKTKCPKCYSEMKFSYDYEVMLMIQQEANRPPPLIKTLFNFDGIQ